MTLEATFAEVVDASVRDAIRDELEALTTRPLVVTPDEAARLLCVSRRTVDRWLAEGVLPRMPHTNRVLIPRVALESFVNGAAS